MRRTTNYSKLAKKMNFGSVEKCSCSPVKIGHVHYTCLKCGLDSQCKRRRAFLENNHVKCENKLCENSSDPHQLKKWKKEALRANLAWLEKTSDRAYGLFSCRTCFSELKVQYTHVRENNVRCEVCASDNLSVKYDKEAKKAGYQITGVGNGPGSLLYRCLTCGEERSRSIVSVRNGIKCLNCDWFLAGIKKGLVQLSAKHLPNSAGKKFAWKDCGHIKFLQNNQLKKGNPECQECKTIEIEQKQSKEAEQAGLVYLKKVNKDYAEYEHILCGCRETKQVTHVRRNLVRCGNCFSSDLEDRLAKEARSANLTYVGPGSSHSYRKYKCLVCMSVEEKQPSVVRKKQVACTNCFKNELQSHLAGTGHKLIRLARNEQSAILELNCGHEQEVSYERIRTETVDCLRCGDSYLSQRSYVYLFEISFGEKKWLKLGMARNPDARKSGYGLNPQARIVEKSRVELKTGYDANRFEQKLLRMYRSKRLLSEDIRHMMKSGHSECFPVSMKKELIGALQNR